MKHDSVGFFFLTADLNTERNQCQCDQKFPWISTRYPDLIVFHSASAAEWSVSSRTEKLCALSCTCFDKESEVTKLQNKNSYFHIHMEANQ